MLFASDNTNGALPISMLIGKLSQQPNCTTVICIKASLSAGDDLIDKDTGKDARDNICAAFELRFKSLDPVDQTGGRHTGTHGHDYPIFAYQSFIDSWIKHTEAMESWRATGSLTVFDRRKNRPTYRPATWAPKVATSREDYEKKMQIITDLDGTTRPPRYRPDSEVWIAFLRHEVPYEAQAFYYVDKSKKLTADGEKARAQVMSIYGLRDGHGLYFTNLVHVKPVKSILTAHRAVTP
jgi:hypothetical protein